MSYDLIDLKFVKAIAECGTLTQGAAKIGLSPSSASVRLTQFESTLNVLLFIRRARGLTPTIAGFVALRHVSKILTQLSNMESDFGISLHGE
ncbi:MAG: LysR family transcriptional regulator [Gammaproteobacteria bacterium]|nr:LysR family transcriptional regulator [Gammaproteobacteria bacterium]MBU1603381.1 LysR family transcriptional regulator [Gammaproteobacteria bacterium]MBU2432901.1 LysR family transcriptional regulator [Gammaproteobacteria bacterium]MBU2450144.1 LysR family transcriptional regulator [Gammaproteobacteria bacterium]